MNSPIRHHLLSGVLALSVVGCSMLPDYVKPQAEIPEAFKEEGPWHFAHPSDTTPRGEWWKGFNDPLLNALEVRLDLGSLELAQALARHDGAEAVLAGQNASLFPEITSVDNYTTNRQSANRPLRGSNQPNIYGTTTLQAGLSYELDLWGRLRSAVASAQASEAASASDIESLRLSLHAQLANTYIQLRGTDSQIQILTESINAYQRQTELIARRHKEGIVSGLDVSRAETLLEETRSQKTQAESQRALYEHAIATLLGESVYRFTIPPQKLNPIFPAIPVSVPSTVLERRPDIAAAERRVMAANAEIGLAKAAFYPTIFLGAQGGFQNTGQGNLISTPNSFWSLGPSAFFSIFDAGRRDAAVQQATARTQEATARYKSTVLNAFKEVEDNLSLLHHLAEENEFEFKASQFAQRTFDLAMNQYREGAISYLEVIDAETTKLRTEQAQLRISVQRMQASISLVRALGGDW